MNFGSFFSSLNNNFLFLTSPSFTHYPCPPHNNTTHTLLNDRKHNAHILHHFFFVFFFFSSLGDFTNHNGTGGCSIYGRSFPDELPGLRLRHTRPGLLSMANSGPNTNGSQFFVTTVPTPWLDGKHVVFGEVVKGYDLVKQVEMTPTNSRDQPLQPIVVDECGVVNV